MARALAAQAGGFMPPALVMIFRLGCALQDGSEPFEHVEEIGGEAGLRVALLLQRQDRHGQLGEVFERQVIEPALLGQQHRGVEVVAPEAAAVADANGFHRPPSPSRRLPLARYTGIRR